MKISSNIKYLAIFPLLLLLSEAVTAERIRVTLLVPGSSTHLFWGSLVKFAQAAANDLDIELNAEFAAENTYSIKKKATAVVNSADKPDYLIAVYIEKVMDEVMLQALDGGVKLMILNTDLPDAAKKTIGMPREKYPNLIGHMMPDDVRAGSLLAETLAGMASNSSKQTQFIALGGTHNTMVAIDRSTGLRSQLRTMENVELKAYTDCDWSPETAASQTKLLMQQNGEVNVIWAASDAMALRAMSEVESAGLKLNKEVFVGGFDWSDAGIKAVANNKLATTVGGHFMDGAWALVLIRDYHEDIDFIDELGPKILTSMQVITPNNVHHYREKFGDRDWEKIDFKVFSKGYSPNLKKYDFSLHVLLN